MVERRFHVPARLHLLVEGVGHLENQRGLTGQLISMLALLPQSLLDSF